MRQPIAALALCVAFAPSIAMAQISNPPMLPPLASTADVTAAKAASQQASTDATNALAIARASVKTVNTLAPDANGAVNVPLPVIPSPCAAPLPDTLVGTAGVGTPCMARPDATRPTLVQRAITTTATDATWSITFDVPFTATPGYADARIYGTSQPYLCTVQTLSATGASGKCFQLVATTLPTITTSLLGLVVSPFQTAGAGLSVRVVARQ